MAEYKYLDLVGLKHYDEKIKVLIDEKDAAALAAAKQHAIDLGANYDPAGTAATKVQELADGQVKKNTDAIGTIENLETTSKSDIVTALNEVRNSVSAGGTAAQVTLTESTTGLADGVAKAYVLKQGDNTVGTINIPKDMVVQSGEVVVNPEGQEAGTYIKLTLANATNDIIYVNVGTLVDIYKAQENATQIQLAIDSATRAISASIVAGSVTATELAADAVTTVKIADGNVTKAKLATDVIAYVEAEADAAESAAKGHADDLNTAMDTRVKSLEAKFGEGDDTVDAKIAAAKAEAISAAAGDATAKVDELKEYVDEKAVQADWNQNDETAPDYVKNRTHYDNSSVEYLLENMPVSGMQQGAMGSGTCYYPEGVTIDWEVGKTYYLNFNGQVYSGTGYESEILFSKIPHPTDPSRTISPEFNSDRVTGVGFYDVNYDWANSDLTMTLYSGTVDIKQLDEKFIPDTIARVADVESLNTRMSTAEEKISVLEGKVSANEQAIATLEASLVEITTAEIDEMFTTAE